MNRYFIRRILETIPLMLVISIFVFMFIHLIPGDPARTIAGLDAEESEVQAIREEYDLDKPLVIQYVKYMGKLIPRKYGTKHEIRHTGHRAYSYPYEDNVKTCVCGNSVGTGTGNFYWSDLGDQEGKSVGSRLYVLSH